MVIQLKCVKIENLLCFNRVMELPNYTIEIGKELPVDASFGGKNRPTRDGCSECILNGKVCLTDNLDGTFTITDYPRDEYYPHLGIVYWDEECEYIQEDWHHSYLCLGVIEYLDW